MKIIWSPLSTDRIQEIAEYISNDSIVEAQNWIEDIFENVSRLERFPEIGRKVTEIKKNNYRELIVGNYRVVYRIDDKQIVVLTVRHFKQILPINEIKTKKDKI